MSHLGVGNRFQTKDIVSALLSGKALDDKEEQIEQVDGRTKEYKGAVKRMGGGGRRKEGPDCRTKGYRATVARIAARASKSVDVQVEEGSKKELNELFSDVDFLIDQLSNSMEFYNEDEFVEFMSDEIKMSPEIASEIFNDYLKLSPQVRNQNAYGWKKWLEKYGIR